MTALESIVGCCCVEVTTADVSRFLDQIAVMGIRLQEVIWDNDLIIRFQVSRHSMGKLQEITKRHGAELKVISRMGVYWDILNLWKRPVFLFCMCLMVLLGVFLPGRIYFVKVQGNSVIETARILESAAVYGIQFGASRRLVRSEQVKNQLIGAIPELGWVGVNTKGCVAVISVREKAPTESMTETSEPCDIIALRDGIILDCSATRGSLLCTPGQAVSKGDILISGSGNLMNVDTITGTAGEVFAATKRQIRVLTPGFVDRRGDNRQRKVNFSLYIGKNLINFFKGSGISGATCVKMYSKYVLTLPGGFSLPVSLIKWTLISCDTAPEAVSEDDAKVLLSQFASSYLEGQMIAGSIVQKCELLAQADGIYQMTGDYACTEMISRAQKEQIGAYHGKTD